VGSCNAKCLPKAVPPQSRKTEQGIPNFCGQTACPLDSPAVALTFIRYCAHVILQSWSGTCTAMEME
jgi:hypothetical protein